MVIWQHRRGELELPADVPVLMGILNVTPDSFSDGGKFMEVDRALEQSFQMLEKGAAIIDIGGESTRPGAADVSATEEADRVLPVIEKLSQEKPEALISIDTTKAEVARQSVAAGADIVNDVSAARWDDEMLSFLASHEAQGCGYVCMHAQGRPRTMQNAPSYENVLAEVEAFLDERCQLLVHLGVSEKRLLFDAGVGFGKSLEHNLTLISNPTYFDRLSRPLLWGVSRKSFISHALGVGSSAGERHAGNLSAHLSLMQDFRPSVWRVHDVAEIQQALDLWRQLRSYQHPRD